MTKRIAVVGGGWAGIAAAVRGTETGCRVTLFETAAALGGRARTVRVGETLLDNGQHILIGAYVRTLALMRSVGIDTEAVLRRLPLELRRADGRGLALPAGPPALAFVRGVLAARGWTAGDKAALLAAAAGWALRGFDCDPRLTVAQLCAQLPARVRSLLIDPLCVAALNTPTADASAAVLLRVLRDALFTGRRGGADLLLPRRPLGALLPEPAAHWLAAHGADLRLGTRVLALRRNAAGWDVDGTAFDAVVLACSAGEAARLAAAHAPGWAAIAAALRHEPIVTVYLRAAGAHLPAPMTALDDGPDAPAQFAFDHGAIHGADGGSAGVFAFVVSGAAGWVARGLDATAAAVLRQAAPLLPGATLLQTIAEKRATFACTPASRRPPLDIAPGLFAAGDHVAGPYPSTLEGAVRAGEAAVAAACVHAQ